MPSFFSSLLGSKPEVPNLPSLSLGAEQQKALAANQAAIPGAENIATQVDLFNQNQIDKMLSSVIPNYKAITGNVSRNIASLTAGQIPQDVQQAIASSDASRSLSGGFGGTGAGRNLQARDLGLTSLDLTQRGLSSAESWIRNASSIYEAGNFNVASMFITPAQQASFDVEERNSQFQMEWMQNQIAAQPAMWAQDLKEAVQTAISIYSHTPPQHAGTLPVQGSNLSTNFSGGDSFGAPYSPGAGEGGAAFDSPETAQSDYAAGGGMDAGGGGFGGAFA